MHVAAHPRCRSLETRASRRITLHVQIGVFQKLNTIAWVAQRASEFSAFYRAAFPFWSPASLCEHDKFIPEVAFKCPVISILSLQLLSWHFMTTFLGKNLKAWAHGVLLTSPLCMQTHRRLRAELCPCAGGWRNHHICTSTNVNCTCKKACKYSCKNTQLSTC